MHSAVITADHRYRAVPLAGQPGHERIVRLGPLVLESAPLNTPAPTTDTDRTVSRRSEPSSCTTLTGEQPDPWDLLQPQDGYTHPQQIPLRCLRAAHQKITSAKGRKSTPLRPYLKAALSFHN